MELKRINKQKREKIFEKTEAHKLKLKMIVSYTYIIELVVKIYEGRPRGPKMWEGPETPT